MSTNPQLDLALERETDAEAAFARGDISLRVDAPRDGESLVHVMSRPAGGEVRGYRLCVDRGCAHVRLPAHEGHWPEMDALVARELRCSVVGLDQGGVYTGQVIHPLVAKARR